jgi:hypothetical protein
MINPYAQYLAPAPEWFPLLERGIVRLNDNANRVIWAENGQFAAALRPVIGEQAAQQLANLPLDPAAAQAAVQQSSQLSQLAPALQAMKLVSTVGAIASVANVAVSCVGFALVLHRLSKMDAKLDQLLTKIDLLAQAVDRVRTHQVAATVARLAAGGECLERALAATTPLARRELALQARATFQEGKLFYLELWRATSPWDQVDIPLAAAGELQGRLLACALGEIQAEFLLADEGAFRHAVTSSARLLREELSMVPARSFRVRSDQACARGAGAVAAFQGDIRQIATELKRAAEVTAWSAAKVESFGDDFDIVRELSLEPHEVARILRAANGPTIYLLGPAGHADQWRRLAA